MGISAKRFKVPRQITLPAELRSESNISTTETFSNKISNHFSFGVIYQSATVNDIM